MSLIAQWLFSEASSGTTPTTVADSQASPLNLAITFAGAAAWTSNGAGNGLDTPGGATTGARSASITGGKIATAIAGATQATIELVARYDAGSDTVAFAIGEQTAFGSWGGAILVTFGSGGIHVHMGAGTAEQHWFATDPSGTHVWHIVFNTAAASADDRIELWRDGTRVTSYDYAGITQNHALNQDMGPDNYVHCPALTNGTDCFDGAIFYAAFYDNALSSGEIASHVTALAANNDANPNVTPPAVASLTPADGATGVSTSASLQLTFDQNVQIVTGNVRIVEDTPPASAPTVEGRTTDNSGTGNVTSFTIDLVVPSGGWLENDIAIVAISKDGSGDFTDLDGDGSWQVAANVVTNAVARVAVIWKRMGIGASDTTVVVTGPSESYAARAWAISGADPATAPFIPTPVTGSSTAPDPPNATFPWGTDPTLVLAIVGGDGNITPSGFPGGSYGNTGSVRSGHTTTTNNSWLGYAELASTTAGSENPGAFTIATEQWVAITVAIRGAWTRATVETIDITDGGQVSVSGDTVTITPTPGTLDGSTQYHVEIDAGAIEADDDGAPWPGISDVTSWNFTTGAANDLDGDLGAGASASGALTANGSLASASSASASCSATLTANGGLTATCAASASAAGTLDASAALTAPLAGGATCSGDLSADAQGTGSCSAGATLTAAIVGHAALAAGLSAGGSCSGAIAATAICVAALAAGATGAGTLAAAGALSSAAAASAACSGALSGQANAACSTSAGASAAGTLIGATALQGAGTAAASVTGTVSAPASLEAGVSAGASVVGRLDQSLIASVSAGAVASGTLAGTTACAAALSASAVCSGAISANAPVAASLAAAAACSGALAGTGVCAAAASAAATCSATLEAVGFLSASLMAGATCSGGFGLAGSLAAGASCTASLGAAADVASSAAASAQVSGALVVVVLISASLGAGAALSATASSAGELTAPLMAGAGAGATLSATGEIACSLTAAASCVGVGQQTLAASLTCGASCGGVLFGALPPDPPSVEGWTSVPRPTAAGWSAAEGPAIDGWSAPPVPTIETWDEAEAPAIAA